MPTGFSVSGAFQGALLDRKDVPRSWLHPALLPLRSSPRRAVGRRRPHRRRLPVLCCGPDHALLSKGLLQTKITDTGRLAWTDGTRPLEINLVHHPDELLAELFEDD